MELQLIKGHFTAPDAVDIITRIINVKIKYHEGKINAASNEEDIKMREQRIKKLQKELFEVRQHLSSKTGKISLDTTVTLPD